MATPYLGEIRIASFNFPPRGWALCNGQVMAINQNQALFALLGTMYGGNGQTTFQLPNLQASMPIHMGSSFVQGQVGGEFQHTLVSTEVPAHNHTAQGVSTTASSANATGSTWAQATASPYAGTPNTTMSPNSVSMTGGSQPHPNMPPYLTLNFIIALSGIFPTRS
jgi:microcystin-dependent protein